MKDFEQSISKKTSTCIACFSVILLILLDQFTKKLAWDTIRLNGPKELIRGVFSLQYLENSGAAWGMLRGARVTFVIIAVVLSIVLIYLFFRMPFTRRYSWLRLTGILLLAGAYGNMIDRIRSGYVIDFFYFSLINFPIFNVADIYVTVGAFLFFILVLFVYNDEELSFDSFSRKNDDEEK